MALSSAAPPEAADRLPPVFFSLSSVAVALILILVVVGATGVGLIIGHRVRSGGESLREPFGVLQAATLGIVGLLLAFGLTLAIERYEKRRAVVVEEANAIGTAYLRAQTLDEPIRSESLDLLRRYNDVAITVAEEVPGSDAMAETIAAHEVLQRRLWSLAGQSLRDAPVATAPRLYVDSLNEVFDQESTRVAALNNRVPGAVLTLEVVAAALALGLLALYLAVLGRGPITVVLAALLVTMLLYVTFDLDRPTRGLITIPEAPFVSLKESMDLPPAAE